MVKFRVYLSFFSPVRVLCNRPQDVHKMSLVLLLKVCLSSVGLSRRKQCSLIIVSGKVNFNACQVSLLLHNYVLVQKMFLVFSKS